MSDPIERLNAALEGRYRIDRELGEGGMATVYLADDLKHERKVALKVLKPALAAIVATLVISACSGAECVSGPQCGAGGLPVVPVVVASVEVSPPSGTVVPTLVSGGLTFSSVSSSDGIREGIPVYHTCGVTTAGTAYCWGSGSEGQLGNGSTADKLVPTLVSGGLTFASVSAGTVTHRR